jgi:hypothetical protein
MGQKTDAKPPDNEPLRQDDNIVAQTSQIQKVQALPADMDLFTQSKTQPELPGHHPRLAPSETEIDADPVTYRQNLLFVECNLEAATDQEQAG